MKLRVGALFASLSLIATPAGAVMLRDVAPCFDARDQPVCLLKLTADQMGGSLLLDDPEFAAHPEILTAVGLSEAKRREWIAGGPSMMREYLEQQMALRAASLEVLARDKAGVAPGEAFAPLMSFTVPSGMFASARFNPALVMVRMPAYAKLIQGTYGRKPSIALTRVILQAWENDLRPMAVIQGEWPGALALAKAYAEIGDEAGVERVAALLPDSFVQDRIGLLTQLGRLDAAVALARATTVDTMVAAQLELFAKAGEATEDEDLKLIREIADEDLTESLVALADAAAKAGRKDLAREVADRLFREADPKADLANVMMATPQLAPLASPEIAAAWIDRLEAGLHPYDGKDAGEPHLLETRAIAVGGGWLAMGRKDRFDTFLSRWAPIARTELENRASAPGDMIYARALFAIYLEADRLDYAAAFMTPGDEKALLTKDIARGRGAANLDRYLTMAASPLADNEVLHTCLREAAEIGDDASLLACAGRVEPDWKHADAFVSERALRGAAVALRAGRPDSAARMLTLARSSLRKIPPPEPGTYGGDLSLTSTTDLIEIARMQLRADGRLPPLAIPAER